MKGLLASDVSADLSMLMEGFGTDKRIIPSASDSFKFSVAIPALASVLSFASASIVYFSGYEPQVSVQGLYNYFLNDGWVFVAPTIIVGLFFTLMAYNNVLLYLTIPDSVRERSIVIEHLRKIARRTIMAFVALMVMATVLSAYSTWFAFSITGLLFALLIVVSMTVGVEINRLGAGVVLEKISALFKKI